LVKDRGTEVRLRAYEIVEEVGRYFAVRCCRNDITLFEDQHLRRFVPDAGSFGDVPGKLSCPPHGNQVNWHLWLALHESAYLTVRE
jgi:hypothetical protein